MTRETQVAYLMQLMATKGADMEHCVRRKAASGRGIDACGFHISASAMEEALQRRDLEKALGATR